MLHSTVATLTISIHTTTQVVTNGGASYSALLKISIHTTTQVVTIITMCLTLPQVNFNPHHHAGGDIDNAVTTYTNNDFNPHHHAGGDGRRGNVRHNQYYFNPHHHAGGDGRTAKMSKYTTISIHTTTQVVTM